MFVWIQKERHREVPKGFSRRFEIVDVETTDQLGATRGKRRVLESTLIHTGVDKCSDTSLFVFVV
jgi:hypothetical protein